MELKEYEVMYRVEDTHWWYHGMKAITCGVLDRFVGSGQDLDILDAGCGTGAAMEYLINYGQVTGVDFEPLALEFCRQRGLERLHQASVLDMPFNNASFDLVTSFDVLCSLDVTEHDAGLREFARVLRPSGHLLLRLPAYRWLRGKHDDAVHIRNRFTRPELRYKLQSAGFRVEHLSYANTTLFPLAAIKRLCERIVPYSQTGSDLTISTAFLNTLFHRVLAAESPFIRTIGLPFGLTVIALARKPT
ncbi:class I SAM-dependent methyltransferase [Pseudomonadota bacterium]